MATGVPFTKWLFHRARRRLLHSRLERPFRGAEEEFTCESMGDTDGSISRTLGLVHLEPELAFYRRQLKRESAVLLLGCATGWMSSALAREGPVVAVDP